MIALTGPIYPPPGGAPGDRCQMYAQISDRSARYWLRTRDGHHDRYAKASARGDRNEARRLRVLAAELEWQADWDAASPTERKVILRGLW